MTLLDTPCCEEYAALARTSRRSLLRGALVAGSTTVFGGAVMETAFAAPARKARGVLVVLSLRGAADGMSLVVPHGDPVYYQARPRIGIPRAQLLGADGFFGMHPALSPLMPLWNAGRLGWVHASGLPAPNRSHFSAMEQLEDAAPGSSTRTGWLNRLIGLPDGDTSPLQALNIGTGVPPSSLAGPAPYMNASRVEDIRLAGAKSAKKDRRRQSLDALWKREKGPLGDATRRAFSVVQTFDRINNRPGQGAPTGNYPKGDLGKAFANAARVIRGDIGVEVITIDYGKWDMHSGLGDLSWGAMLENATELARAVAAFFADLGPQAAAVTLVGLSEFGRRVQENPNMGLDHGYGNVMMVAGAGVRGGYYAQWPGITNELDSDLLVTTDYRSVLAEVVAARFNVSTAAIFPGFVREPVGVMYGQ